jgi:hypothetical protein
VTVLVGPGAVVVCCITLVKIIVEPSKVVVRTRVLPGAVVTSVDTIVEAGSVCVIVEAGMVDVNIKVLPSFVVVSKTAGKVERIVEAGCVSVCVSVCCGNVLVKITVLPSFVVVSKIVEPGAVDTSVSVAVAPAWVSVAPIKVAVTVSAAKVVVMA